MDLSGGHPLVLVDGNGLFKHLRPQDKLRAGAAQLSNSTKATASGLTFSQLAAVARGSCTVFTETPGFVGVDHVAPAREKPGHLLPAVDQAPMD